MEKNNSFTPVNIEDVLPAVLTTPESSLSDARLFLSLFHTKNSNSVFYEIDVFGSNCYLIEDPFPKVKREIKAAILGLLDGKTVEEDQKTPLGISHVRTICLLLLLDQLFSKEINLINSLHKKSPSSGIITEDNKEWFISYPQLLVQAVRLSQWEHDNQDYCFEFFTARRAREYLLNHMKKWFDIKDKGEDEDKKLFLKKIMRIFTRLIRWHTIEGQYLRCTSEFGIKELVDTDCIIDNKHENEKYVTKEEIELLNVFSCLDIWVRDNFFEYEQKINQVLNQQTSSGVLTIDILKHLKTLTNDDNEQLYARYYDIERREGRGPLEEEKGIIRSYMMPARVRLSRDEKHQEKLNKKMNDNCRKLFKAYEEKYKEQSKDEETESRDLLTVTHFSVDRNIRRSGLLDKLIAQDDLLDNIKDKFDFNTVTKLEFEEDGGCFPVEKMVRVIYFPGFVVKILYGLEVCKTKDSYKNHLSFLEDSFKAIGHKYEAMKRIPLPMVKRILDLLPSFNLLNDGSHVFPLRISFDHGEAQFDVWLPEQDNQDNNESMQKTIIDEETQLNIEGILLRYINCLISNYGMTHQYNHVDLDFSASQYFKSGVPHKWHSKLIESHERLDCPDNLGLKVFNRYLLDVGIENLETSYSQEKYISAIEKRKVINQYRFEKDIEELKLEDKYILGIDIGATGIKLKFFKIIKEIKEENKKQGYTYYVLSKQSVRNDPDRNTHHYLVPLYIENVPLEFTMPTFPRKKVDKPDKENKYKDAMDFASYIVNTLVKRLETLDERIKKNICKDCFNRLLSVGFCWPGPIKQNTPASTSRILENFKGFSNQITENKYTDIIQLDVENAVKEAFEKKKKELNLKRNPNDHQYESLTVALQNDGDVEASGLAFGMLNEFKKFTNEDFSRKKEFFNELLRNHTVIVIKAGTGTAGSFLKNGEIKGLNEFGKLIVDLGADNRSNLNKDWEKRWPSGDANKFFSMATFRGILEGIPANVSKEVTGFDISFLIQIGSLKTFQQEEFKIKFGALELISISTPHIELNEIFDQDGLLKSNITLRYDSDENAFKIIQSSKKSFLDENIDAYTWYNLASEPLIAPLSLHSNEPKPFKDLLEELGRYRISRLNLEEVFKRSGDLEKSIEKIGEQLGDVIALLYDIYKMKGVIVAGGIMSDDNIADACMEGLDEALQTYLFDTFFEKDQLIKRIEEPEPELKPNESAKKMIEKNKLIIYRTGENHALLGAAIAGFDHYITTHKIKELQEIAKIRKGVITDKIRFLTKKEALSFLTKNAGQLRITVNEIEGKVDISSIE